MRYDAPKALRETIERALMKAPEDRWPTATAMREAILSERVGAPTWRSEQREPVRYTSPRPDGARVELRAVSPRRGNPAAPPPRPSASAVVKAPNGIEMEQEHLASLTAEQRADLRLWHGRVNLLDRVKAMRGHALVAFAATILAVIGFVVAFEEGAPPLVVAPIVPLYMGIKLWRRGKSLRRSGLRLRRVLLMPRARYAIPALAAALGDRQLEKLATREVLDSALGTPVRRATEDRAAILEIAAKLPKEERKQLRELEPTVNGLVERVASLAQMIQRLDHSIDLRLIDDVYGQIAVAGREAALPGGERRLAMLRRQRVTLDEIVKRQGSHIAIAEKLLSEPPKERFDRMVVDKKVANREGHLRDLRKLYDKYQYNSAMYGPRPGMYPLPGEFRSHERSRHSQMAGIHGRGDRPGRQPWRIDFGRTWRRPVQS